MTDLAAAVAAAVADRMGARGAVHGVPEAVHGELAAFALLQKAKFRVAAC